ncbi:hypothetical protein [Nocardia coubleae]|uniref:Uncharacterized protein n=1 Tax=Nocardia coubleae TaxID=356147 RepID=A0A846W494_9NOCA|nr:hypothetical protein [Nocardia coubleae]NKX88001.1 hypothetical protein [Nocardia coubleae]
MTEPIVTSKDELTLITSEFEKQVEKWKAAPDKINETVDDLKWYNPSMWAAITSTRDSIQDQLVILLDKLNEAGEGIGAPFLFIDLAHSWTIAGNIVGKATNYTKDPEISLDGSWEGSAYDAFKAVRESQQTAMASTKEMCQKVHTELLTLAAEGRVFYKSIVDGTAPLLTEYGEGLTETATGVGALWGINKINDAVVNTVGLVTRTITGFIELQSKVVISSNELRGLTQHPAGFVTKNGLDHWPGAVTDGYDQERDGWEART